MTDAMPVQEFQIGQRVRLRITGQKPFVIQSIYCLPRGSMRYCHDHGYFGFLAGELTLYPERPPYVPSERRIVDREPGRPAIHSHLTALYRCETDAELAARLAVERAEYDAQGDEV